MEIWILDGRFCCSKVPVGIILFFKQHYTLSTPLLDPETKLWVALGDKSLVFKSAGQTGKLDVHFSSLLFLIIVFTQARRFASNLQQSVL